METLDTGLQENLAGLHITTQAGHDHDNKSTQSGNEIDD